MSKYFYVEPSRGGCCMIYARTEGSAVKQAKEVADVQYISDCRIATAADLDSFLAMGGCVQNRTQGQCIDHLNVLRAQEALESSK